MFLKVFEKRIKCRLF